VLNLRPNAGGEVTEHESAVYVNTIGNLAVEDLQDGGDLDFNDGNYLQIHYGVGQAQLLGQQSSENIDITVTTEIVETPLTPLGRVDISSEPDVHCP